ncbi:MAG: polyamine aminopropyltransferase [Alphaproteobacteria bacterium]|nr:polyamine aminopropyltransferase [Alphaproteobacteria bacterium]MDG1886996.1 polyamine aminopropyltransferase [Alphaproteobacteria bacterium]
MSFSQKNWWHERNGELGVSILLDAKTLHKEKSEFQDIEILKHDHFGTLLVLDGYIQACQADEFIYHEMAVHVPLLGYVHDKASVLIVGGGDGGILREVLVHDFVDTVTMVEIDHRVIKLSNKFLGIQGNYDDPRVSLRIEDAAAFVKGAISAGKKFDLIVLDLTEPVGPSANLFTEKFISSLSTIVTEKGVILDSDSIFISKIGSRFLQEESAGVENLINVMRRKKFLPKIDIYRTNIPFFPGADFGFFIYSQNNISLREPKVTYVGRHYDPDIHKAAFILPKWQQYLLE